MTKPFENVPMGIGQEPSNHLESALDQLGSNYQESASETLIPVAIEPSADAFARKEVARKIVEKYRDYLPPVVKQRAADYFGNFHAHFPDKEYAAWIDSLAHTLRTQGPAAMHTFAVYDPIKKNCDDAAAITRKRIEKERQEKLNRCIAEYESLKAIYLEKLEAFRKKQELEQWADENL
jgi:hypothetical protein